jgi:hypothetical protein
VVKRPKYFGCVSQSDGGRRFLSVNDATAACGAIFVTASVILTARRDVLE